MTTDELLAIKLEHLKPSLWKRINRKLGLFKRENHGDLNVEVLLHISHNRLKWIKWNELDTINELPPTGD